MYIMQYELDEEILMTYFSMSKEQANRLIEEEFEWFEIKKEKKDNRLYIEDPICIYHLIKSLALKYRWFQVATTDCKIVKETRVADFRELINKQAGIRIDNETKR